MWIPGKIFTIHNLGRAKQWRVVVTDLVDHLAPGSPIPCQSKVATSIFSINPNSRLGLGAYILQARVTEVCDARSSVGIRW